MDKYTTEELEEMVERSLCYRDSNSFQRAMSCVKKHEPMLYHKLLYDECVACGAIE